MPSTFTHLSAAILRAPLLPLSTPGNPHDREGTFRLGLLAAAPAFLSQLDSAHQGGSMDPKLRRSLLKYQLRASGRCTPFGTFAGLCTLPAVSGPDVGVIIGAPECHHINIHADAVWRAGLDAQRNQVSADARYRVNQSLYRAGGEYRFATARTESGNTYYDLNSVPADPVLDAVLKLAAAGATRAQLGVCVAATAGVEAEEAAQFVGELVVGQVLVPESGALLTGSESAGWDSECQIPEPDGESFTAGSAQRITPAGFARLQHRLNALIPGRQPLEPALQLDMYLNCQGGVPIPRLNELAREISDLAPLAVPYHLPLLDAFKARFAARYELRAVPLLEALDPDLGIGYGAADPGQWTGALLAGLPLAAAVPDPRPAGNAAQQAFIRRKLIEAFRSGATAIVISKDELTLLATEPQPAFPKTQSLMGTMRESGDDDGWQFCLSYAGGASAVSLLGRFCQGSEPVAALVEELVRLETEAEPECILAEIVHLPAATLGNVSRRPVLRRYEIPYLGRSGAPPEDQIPVDDLYLQLRDNELCLFSRRLRKRVLPRLGTAHNFAANALPVYRLLCELQFQSLSLPLSWDWGVFRDEPFLPAVCYGHIQLCRRSWGFDATRIARMSPDEFLSLLHSMSLPRQVCCGLGDQQLLIHLDDPEQAALLQRELLAQPGLRVYDACVETGAAFVRNSAGAPFANELIVPLFNTRYRPSRGLPAATAGGPEVERSVAPGLGRWHYLKLYGGYAHGDALLRGGLSGRCADLLADGLISHWFFLRYEDPEPHLRLRFCLCDPASRQRLEAALQPWLGAAFESGLLHRIVVDTYHRELERYGAAAIESVEELFAADSACTLAFLNSTEDPPDEQERFAFACVSIDLLLRDAGLHLPERREMIGPLAAAFFDEHGGGIPLQQSLNESYRQHRIFLESLLSGAANGTFQPALEARSRRNQALFKALPRDAVLSLMPDLVHMLVNRIFIAMQRRYELLVYHCLAKLYRSAAARTTPAAASGRLRE